MMRAESWVVREMLVAGASGYVLKEDPVEDSLRAIRAASTGAGSSTATAIQDPGRGPAPTCMPWSKDTGSGRPARSSRSSSWNAVSWSRAWAAGRRRCPRNRTSAMWFAHWTCR